MVRKRNTTKKQPRQQPPPKGFGDLPLETTTQILVWTSQHPFELFSLRRVCRLWNDFLVSGYFSSTYLSTYLSHRNPSFFSGELGRLGLSLHDRFWFSHASPPAFQLEYAKRILATEKGNRMSSDRMWPYSVPSAIPDAIQLLTNLTQLTLKKMNLQGHIPAGICLLVNLKILDLSRNALSGSVESVAKMDSLVDVCLSYNQLSGPIPSVNWRNVAMVSLSHNRLTGTLDALFGSINRSIQLLYLDNNQFSGQIPTLLPFTMLYHLFLNANQLDGCLPSDFKALTNLRALSLMGNRLCGTITGLGWESLQFATKLDLSNNCFTGAIPPEIWEMSRLEDLNLSCNQFDGHLPDIAGFRNLIDAVFCNNRLSGNLPASLAASPKLRNLSLEKNCFSGMIPQSFADGLSRSLKVLRLNDNLLEGPLPNGMGRWNVKKLFLKNNPGLKKAVIPRDIVPRSVLFCLLRENGLIKCEIHKSNALLA